MSNSELEQIQSNYDDYLRRYPEEGSVQAKLEYPLQSQALIQGGYTGNTHGELEQELLISYDKSLPDLELLSVETLSKLPVELMKILKVQVTPDHREYWKWTFWLLEDVNEEESIFPEGLLEDLETLFRLSYCLPIPTLVHTRGRHPKQAGWNIEGHEAHAIYRAKHIAAYLSFPLLEGLIKSVCSDDIKMNGEIRKGKRIKRYHGGYATSFCYRLRDLLTHLEDEHASSELRRELKHMRMAIGEFYHRNPDKIYQIIDGWRNTSLHGQNAPDAEYGTIVNLLCLIIWNKMKSVFQ